MESAEILAERDYAASSGNFAAHRLSIEGPLLIKSRRFADDRGFFVETYNARDLAALGLAGHFVQDNHSLSLHAGTIRGLHFQLHPYAQGKLVRVVRGAILDIAVDIRRSSLAYRRNVAVELSATTGDQLYVPVGFAHGFCTLAPNTEVIYKVTAPYAPELDRGIAWDDPDLALPWPVGRTEAVLSPKDRAAPRLRDIPPSFE
jgi:dTDP-4-dehydrorhamnose 3,5-epimerase